MRIFRNVYFFASCFTLVLVLFWPATDCMGQTSGCTDYEAINYDPNAITNNGSCTYPATAYSLPVKTGLNLTLKESSGLVYVNGALWSHNDSGDGPYLYRVDTTSGAILQTVKVTNATNNDWEDITTDGTFLYIGDVGNNAQGNRTDLRVYKVKLSDIGSGTTSSVTAEIIKFAYADQTDFTKKSNNSTNFDCEALVFYQDSLHLFSKDWLDYQTRHYVIPAIAGNYTAQLKETLNVNGLITAATVSPTNEIVLLGYDLSQFKTFLWRLSDFTSTQFFSHNKRRVELGSVFTNGQVEGIAFKNNKAGFISCETRNFGFFTIPQQLYDFTIVHNPRQPGSGKALSFNGSTSYVSAMGKDLDKGDFTLEAWIKPATGASGGILSQGGYTTTGYFLGVDAAGRLRLGTMVGSTDNGTVISDTSEIVSGQWQHVAASVTRGTTGNLTILYVNGKQVAAGNIGTGDLTNTALQIGKVSNAYFTGEIDEVRIWKKALPTDTLRAWMCQKLYIGHPDYASLQSYFRFDEGVGSTTLDWETNSNATLINSPTWVSSGAALGDVSLSDYTAPTTLKLTHPQGDSLSVQLSSGTVDAIHLYRVQETAVGASLPAGAYELDQTRYWGTFLVGGSASVYTATYHYQGHTGIQDETKIRLLYRTNNAGTSWIGTSVLDTNTHTLTLTGMTGTEYALAGDDPSALPITLVDFTAELTDHSSVLLQWTTAAEVNNDRFEVERSADARHFIPIATVDGSGNSHETLTYRTVDANPLRGVNYYRLKQLDYDGRATYSKIKAVQVTRFLSGVQIAPNPFDQQVAIHFSDPLTEEATICLSDVWGRVILNQTAPASSQDYLLTWEDNLLPGFYFLVITHQSESKCVKLIKQ